MPIVNPGHEADMLERAASACRNVTKDEWFAWVAPHLDALAVRLNDGMASHPPRDRAGLADDDWLNELLANSPDSWDDDVACEAIALDYVHALEDRLKKLGGCLNKWCRWEDDEPCDHGYLAVEDAEKAYAERLDENGHVTDA